MDNADTRMSPEWITNALKKNPCVAVTKDGVPTGNFRTCPVRLSFPNVFKPVRPPKNNANEPDREPQYGTTILFPVGADLRVLEVAAEETLKIRWPDLARAGALHRPFRDQAGKSQFQGYNPGGIFFSANANLQHKPSVIDTSLRPIVDESAIYPGVWAVVVLRPFPFDAKMKKGVSFGLQSVMKICDDIRLGGGSVDVIDAYEGVSVDPSADISALV